MSKYMRMLVFFDLPVTKKEERKAAARFRSFLLKEGYYMVQFSVYSRVCNGNDAVETVSYDPEEAKKLLEESGWTDTDGDGYVDKGGQKLTINWLTYPTRLEQPKLAEYAQATLKDIGIDVSVNNTSDHRTYAENGEFDVYVSSLTTAPTGDPEYFFSSTVTGSKNYGNYQNDEVTRLTDQLHQTFDTEERGKLAVELQQKILDDDAYFFVSHLNMGIVTKANVTGMAAHPCDYYEITADLDVQ